MFVQFLMKNFAHHNPPWPSLPPHSVSFAITNPLRSSSLPAPCDHHHLLCEKKLSFAVLLCHRKRKSTSFLCFSILLVFYVMCMTIHRLTASMCECACVYLCMCDLLLVLSMRMVFTHGTIPLFNSRVWRNTCDVAANERENSVKYKLADRAGLASQQNHQHQYITAQPSSSNGNHTKYTFQTDWLEYIYEKFSFSWQFAIIHATDWTHCIFCEANCSHSISFVRR